MKVIDASVGFKALVTEADSAKAIQLVEDYRNGVTERTSTPLRSPTVSREPSGKASGRRSKTPYNLASGSAPSPTFAGASAKSLRSLIAGANWRLRLSLRGTRRAAWLRFRDCR